MKKHIIYSLLSFLGLCSVVLTGCTKEEIVFDHELPMFETRDGLQLLEVIMPKGTIAGDEIYIVGEFNGGEEVAVGDARYMLEQSTKNDIKWGVYLDPSDFVDGKTLADGYYFYSVAQREEVTLRNTPVLHYENPPVGGRMNVTVDRWAAYFDKPLNPDEIVHDGYAIFVVDNSGYDELAMYAWGDAEAFGGWPGMTPTGSVNIDGVNFKYFDTGDANKGLFLHLIFNNNGNGKQLNDFDVTLNKDYYVELTPDGVVEMDPSNIVKHDGHAVFVIDNTGYDELAMYAWGDAEAFGGWPGMQVTGEQDIKGYTYKYFDLGEANTGLFLHLIFNNNNHGKQLADFDFTVDRDLYLELTESGAREIDPATYDPNGTPEAPEPKECKIYVENAIGWDAVHLYAWGDKEMFGGWPGVAFSETEVIAGRTFYVTTVMAAGEAENLIFNNNAGAQLPDVKANIDRDFYFTLTETEAVEIERPTQDIKIYLENATGWDELYVYAWGDKEAFGGWPGKKAEETVTIDGHTYGVITTTGCGEEHLIFNNNAGTQFDGPVVVFDRDLYYHVTSSEATEVQAPAQAPRRR